MIHTKGKAKYQVIYDGETFIDGFGCDTLDEAIDSAMEVVYGWVESSAEMSDDDWNYFVCNACVYVQELDEETGNYEECWYPNDQDYQDAGFIER